MKKIKSRTQIFLITISSCLMMTITMNAQDRSNEPVESLAIQQSTYNFAIGVRAGGTSGITAKYFIGQQAALEGIFSIWHGGLGVTGLYERHISAFDVSGLNWYYGGGGHAIFAADRVEFYEPISRINGRDFGLGVDGIVGIEYKIPPIPFAVSLDLKPALTVWSDGGVGLGIDPGLGVKLAF